jgi:SMI1 / KNR4 family (SUKH-1)
MSYLEVSLSLLAARESLPEEEMARIIDHIRLTFPYRSGDHLYRSASYYLVMNMAKERLTTKQETWLDELRPTLSWYRDTMSGCPCCNHPFDDAPQGLCEKCHRFDPYKVSSTTLAFHRQDFHTVMYLSRWVWGTIEDVYVRWTAVALAQLLLRGHISVEQISHLSEGGDHITPSETFQNAVRASPDNLKNTLTMLTITFMKQDYLLVQRAAERCHLDIATFIRRAVWSSEAAWYVRCLRAATGRVHGCDLGWLLSSSIDKPLQQIRQLQIETEDVQENATSRLFNAFAWYLYTNTKRLSQEHPLIARKLLEIVKNDAYVSQPERAALEQEKKRFHALNVVPPHDLRPCTEQEVLALEQQLGYCLPRVYREMLLWIGHGAGKLMQDLDCFYEHLVHFQKKARQMLKEHACHLSLPDDALVFFLYQDDCFSFIRASEGEDPPIYAYESTWRRTPFKKVYSRFSDFLALEIEMVADFVLEEKTIPHEVTLMLQTLVDFNRGALFPVPQRHTGEERFGDL